MLIPSIVLLVGSNARHAFGGVALRASMRTESESSPSSPRATVSSARHGEMSHRTTGSGGCGVGCPMCSRITNQCQENKVKNKLAPYNWTCEMCVCAVCVSWLTRAQGINVCRLLRPINITVKDGLSLPHNNFCFFSLPSFNFMEHQLYFFVI